MARKKQKAIEAAKALKSNTAVAPKKIQKKPKQQNEVFLRRSTRLATSSNQESVDQKGQGLKLTSSPAGRLDNEEEEGIAELKAYKITKSFPITYVLPEEPERSESLWRSAFARFGLKIGHHGSYMFTRQDGSYSLTWKLPLKSRGSWHANVRNSPLAAFADAIGAQEAPLLPTYMFLPREAGRVTATKIAEKTSPVESSSSLSGSTLVPSSSSISPKTLVGSSTRSKTLSGSSSSSKKLLSPCPTDTLSSSSSKTYSPFSSSSSTLIGSPSSSKTLVNPSSSSRTASRAGKDIQPSRRDPTPTTPCGRFRNKAPFVKRREEEVTRLTAHAGPCSTGADGKRRIDETESGKVATDHSGHLTTGGLSGGKGSKKRQNEEFESHDAHPGRCRFVSGEKCIHRDPQKRKSARNHPTNPTSDFMFGLIPGIPFNDPYLAKFYAGGSARHAARSEQGRNGVFSQSKDDEPQRAKPTKGGFSVGKSKNDEPPRSKPGRGDFPSGQKSTFNNPSATFDGVKFKKPHNNKVARHAAPFSKHTESLDGLVASVDTIRAQTSTASFVDQGRPKYAPRATRRTASAMNSPSNFIYTTKWYSNPDEISPE
ncbi:hypothetical protein E4T43_03599 [Aureobasidium subglaciale]|nr:hypothetical protein E4T43_03599 [Aureobasidium subglaciale]